MTLALRTVAALSLAAAVTLSPHAASASHATLPVPRTNVRPLQSALVDPIEFAGADADAAFARSRSAGATFARLTLDWRA